MLPSKLSRPNCGMFILGHLSRDCNRPELAMRVVSQRLQQIGATHVKVESTFQDAPCPTLTFGDGPVWAGHVDPAVVV